MFGDSFLVGALVFVKHLKCLAALTWNQQKLLFGVLQFNCLACDAITIRSDCGQANSPACRD